MPLIQDGKIIRTYEEQVQHLTDKHREQEEINKNIQEENSNINDRLDEINQKIPNIDEALNTANEAMQKVTEEETRAKGEENRIAGLVSAEETRATSEEKSIKSTITSEVQKESERAKTREDEIDADLATEILDRTNEDADLRTDIDKNAADIVDLQKLPYIATSESKFSDMGLTTYLIPLSDITPVSPAPVVGSVVFFQTDTSSYIGVVSDVQSSAVSVVAKQKLGGEGGGSSKTTYDTVISTQEEFEAWYAQLDAGTCEYTSVLLDGKNGKFTKGDGNGLHLPETLLVVDGINNATIKITNFNYNSSTNLAALWYTNEPWKDTTDNIIYQPRRPLSRISNICIEFSGLYRRTPDVGFCNCYNLTGCTISHSVQTIDVLSYGYQNCFKLTNCYADIYDVFYGVCAFDNCHELVNCTAYGYGGDNDSFLFHDCSYLTNCIAEILCVNSSNSDGNNAYSFYRCSNLTNCYGFTDIRNSAGHAYGFYECSNLNNCFGKGKSAAREGHSGSANGFHTCVNLNNCTSEANMYSYSNAPEGYHYSYGFYNCQNLTNCTGSGNITQANNLRGYAFYNCKICSNCVAGETTYTTAVWGGTNTNVSKDTCPDYTS